LLVLFNYSGKENQMPIITLKMSQGRTVEQKQKFAEAVTQSAVDILKVKPEWVTVLIEEYPRENWATEGTLHSLKFGPGCGAQGTETEK